MKKLFFIPEKGKSELRFLITEITIGTADKPANMGAVVFPPIYLYKNAFIELNSIKEGGNWFIPKIIIEPENESSESQRETISGDIRNAEIQKTQGEESFIVFVSDGILFQTNLRANEYLKEKE